MNAKEKAIQLVESFKPLVNGYVGSSMLTNTEYPETILRNAKTQTLICVNEIFSELKEFSSDVSDDCGYPLSRIDFFNEVIQEIEKLE